MADDASAVLANPGDHTVEQVLSAFEGATVEQIAETQALEAGGKNRSTITAYSLPIADDEPRFSRERILDGTEGPRITGLSHHVIVGALHGDDASEFTRTQVRAKAEAFRKLRLTPQEA